MSRILAVGTAVPPHRIPQGQVREFALRMFGGAGFDVERLLPVFENTTVQQRHFCVAQEWFEEPHSFAEKNLTYLQSGVTLAEEAIRQACSRSGVHPEDIGHIFFVSTTGISTPSIDAHLFNRLKFRPSILRTPIWGLGCAGGVAGIIRACDWLKAYPEELALVVALELCGLTFVHNDRSKSNFVATSLFADGCGALVMAGNRSPKTAPQVMAIQATAAITWEDTLEVMGWEVVEEGLKVVFSKSIPHVVHRSARKAIEDFLVHHGASLGEIRYFLSHPGGARVVEAYQEALALDEAQVESMRQVLTHYGNMSSATVLFVYEHFLQSASFKKGDLVFSTALGPGFSTEMFLARCE